MLKSIKVLAILTGILSSVFSYAQSGLPFIENYGSDDYAGGIQNWDISQDSYGRLYVANNFGLLIYDGTDWRLIDTADGTKLRSVYVKDDRIYSGYQKNFGYYSPNEIGELVYTSLSDSLALRYKDFDEIWKIYEINDQIYFCGFDFIFKYDQRGISIIEHPNILEISYENQSRLYAQAWELGLMEVIENELRLIEGGSFYAQKRISGIIPYNRSSLLITTFNDGIYLFENGQSEVFKKSIQEEFKKQIVNTAIRLSNGNIAIGTQNNGLYIISKAGEFLVQLNKEKGLMDNTINSIFEDNQGSLWLSMNNGLSRVSTGLPFTIIDDRHGLNGAGYAALKTNGTIYMGTNNGAYTLQNGQANLIPGSEGQVYSIQEFNDRIFIGHNNGLMVVENGMAKMIDVEKGAWAIVPIPNSNDEFIVGTYLGLKKLRINGNDYSIEKIEGFNESSRIMQFDGNQLWVTQGYKGAFLLEFNPDYTQVLNPKLYNSNSGFPSDLLINVFEVENELIFGSESGAFIFNTKEDRFVRFNELNAVVGQNTSFVDLDTDELGNTYFISGDQIGKFHKERSGDYAITTNIFNYILNYWNDDLGNIHAMDADNILIGAREGFIHFDPSISPPSSEDFELQFQRISNQGKNDSTLFSGFGSINSNNIVLPFKQNGMRFEYSVAHYNSENQVSYSYKLSDLQENWSNWTNENQATFTNLREGEYIFEVKARNIYGKESEPQTFRFEIKPPIYRTKFAYGFYTFGTIMMLFMGFKTLDYRHKQEKAEIEDSMSKVINTKEQELKTIEEQSEAEIIRLRNDKLRTELKYKSQELTSSAMHLIQKNQLLNQIKNTLKSLSEVNDPDTKKKLNRIVRSIDKDLSSAEEWAQFEEHFDQVHGQFITRLKSTYPDLTPQEVKFSAYLRMNLNTKEIANLLNISVRGVEIGRYRVRKKLGLERKDNLSDFILRF